MNTHFLMLSFARSYKMEILIWQKHQLPKIIKALSLVNTLGCGIIPISSATKLGEDGIRTHKLQTTFGCPTAAGISIIHPAKKKGP